MFTWKILEIFSDDKNIVAVRYSLSANDGINTVETEGNHVFKDGTVNAKFSTIKEDNLIDWLNSDTTQNDVNAIKENLKQQLTNLTSIKKVDFPWLANTFTPQV